MPSTSHYDDYFRSNLPKEQRRAVLEVLAEELDPETTMGEVIDAAEDIGWGDALGELNLAELAEVLLGEAEEEEDAPAIVAAQAPDEPDEEDASVEAAEVDEVEDDEDEPEPVAKWRGKKVAAKSKKAAKKTTKKKAAKKKAAKKTTTKKTTKKTAKKTAKKKAAKKTTKKSAKKATKKVAKKAAAKKVAKKTTKKKAAKKSAAKKTTKKAAKKKAAKKSAKKPASKKTDGEEEALSLEQAAKLLVPIVRRLKEATMQELEERTGMGRRKLRFHIGQLVKNGHLTRHGMGRGTCYTAARR